MPRAEFVLDFRADASNIGGMSMPADLLALRNAEKHVESYTVESDALMKAHAEAMDCRNCEAFLQMGIDAFDWLMRADRAIRMAICAGETAYDREIDAKLQALAKDWLVPCDFANTWVARQQERGYSVDNLEAFNRCVDEIRAMVESSGEGKNRALPEGIADLRDRAIEEFRNGQTAEFL